MSRLVSSAAAALVATLAPVAAAAADLDALAFLEGRWRGDDGLVFEEIWTGAEGGVMTAMARGVADGRLAVLEYIVVTQEEDAVVMRFKHYRADFSTWETDGPIELRLTAADPNDVTFTADPPSEGVASVRYRMTGADTLQADVDLVEEDGPRSFSLVFDRLD